MYLNVPVRVPKRLLPASAGHSVMPTMPPAAPSLISCLMDVTETEKGRRVPSGGPVGIAKGVVS